MAGAALMWVEGEITARKDVVLPSAISVLLCIISVVSSTMKPCSFIKSFTHSWSLLGHLVGSGLAIKTADMGSILFYCCLLGRPTKKGLQ